MVSSILERCLLYFKRYSCSTTPCTSSTSALFTLRQLNDFGPGQWLLYYPTENSMNYKCYRHHDSRSFESFLTSFCLIPIHPTFLVWLSPRIKRKPCTGVRGTPARQHKSTNFTIWYWSAEHKRIRSNNGSCGGLPQSLIANSGSSVAADGSHKQQALQRVETR